MGIWFDDIAKYHGLKQLEASAVMFLVSLGYSLGYALKYINEEG